MAIVYGANYGAPTLDLNFARNKSLIDTITGRNLVTFTRASTGTYVGADGLIKTAVADEPRFDHNPVTGESLGLLVEEARTNLTPNSMPTTAGGSGGGLTNTLVTGLPGIFSTGRRLTSSGGNDVRILIDGTIGTNGVTYTFSFFARLGTQGNSIFTRLGTSSYTTWNLSTGAITKNDFGTAQIVNCGNGWYRCSSAMPGNPAAFFVMGVGDSGLNAASGDNIIIAGVQNEVGSFPTSYIPTTTATVTRSADQASITGTNFSSWYNQSQGSLLGSFVSLSNGAQAPIAALSQTSDPNANRISLRIANSFCFTGSVAQFSFPTSYTANQSTKVVWGFGSTATYYKNGTLVGTDSSVTLPTALDVMTIGTLEDSAGFPINGTIARLTYYPTRLQDYQLQQLTK